MIKKYFIILIFLFGINILSQTITLQKISDVNIVTINNSNGIVSQIPQSYPGNVKSQNSVIPQQDNPLFNWVLKFTAGNRVFKEVSFYNTRLAIL
jgi:hypothetical protein